MNKLITYILAITACLFAGLSAQANGVRHHDDCKNCERPTIDGRTTGKRVLKKAHTVEVCHPSWDILSKAPIKNGHRTAKWWKVFYLNFNSDKAFRDFVTNFRAATTKEARVALLQPHRPWKRKETIEQECKTFSVAPGTVLLTEACNETEECLVVTTRITNSGKQQFLRLVCKPQKKG